MPVHTNKTLVFSLISIIYVDDLYRLLEPIVMTTRMIVKHFLCTPYEFRSVFGYCWKQKDICFRDKVGTLEYCAVRWAYTGANFFGWSLIAHQHVSRFALALILHAHSPVHALGIFICSSTSFSRNSSLSDHLDKGWFRQSTALSTESWSYADLSGFPAGHLSPDAG